METVDARLEELTSGVKSDWVHGRSDLLLVSVDVPMACYQHRQISCFGNSFGIDGLPIVPDVSEGSSGGPYSFT